MGRKNNRKLMITNLKPNIDKLFMDMIYGTRGYDHEKSLYWGMISRMSEDLELTKMTDKIDTIKSPWRTELTEETLSELEREE